MSRRGISLEEISEEYPIILIDTCALIGYYGYSKSDNANYDSIYNVYVDSANFFKKYIDDGMEIYVTSSVFKEYSDGDSSSVYRKNLLHAIQSNSRILKLDEDERKLHNEMSRKYYVIKDKFGLGYTDYDFLISGGILSKVRKEPVALISNDMGIFHAWKFLLMKENLDLDGLRFIIRIGNETFKKMKPPKNYKKI